jgi:hypothetical protein
MAFLKPYPFKALARQLGSFVLGIMLFLLGALTGNNIIGLIFILLALGAFALSINPVYILVYEAARQFRHPRSK